MHTNPTQTAAEFWGNVLTETYGCWWITCIIEGYENRLYPPGWGMWFADTVLGPLRPLLWKESSAWMSNTLIILPSSASLCWRLCVRAIFSLWDPHTGNLIIVTNKSKSCNIIWEHWKPCERILETHSYCKQTIQYWTEAAALRSSTIKNSLAGAASIDSLSGAACKKVINHPHSSLSALSLILIGGGKTGLSSIKIWHEHLWVFLFFFPLIRC